MAGQRFDLTLIASILCSIGTVMADSVPRLHARYGTALTGPFAGAHGLPTKPASKA